MLDILFEDNHCLAINKPAGLLTQGDSSGDSNAIDLARQDLKIRHARPGDVFVGMVHRLDRPTSGVLLIARTSKAASRLSDQIRKGIWQKTYLAAVEGIVPEPSGTFDDLLWAHPVGNRVEVVVNDRPGSQRAILHYKLLDRVGSVSLIEICLVTGRKHQIRAQFGARSMPIVGDRKYGANSLIPASLGGHRIALHASNLKFKHPTREEICEIRAPLPADWPARLAFR